jgi:hypothetical protein
LDDPLALGEAISINAVFMPKISAFSACQERSSGQKSHGKEIFPLREGGISGDRRWKAAFRTKLATFPP